MSFVRFVLLMRLKTCVRNSFGAFSRWVLENFTEVRSMFETFLGQRICSYVGELEAWDRNESTSLVSKEFEEGQ